MQKKKTESALQDRQVQKRESILRAAIQAFEENGFERASMDRISEIAGASKRTVYNYFDSKENLLRAVIENLVAGQDALKQITYSPHQSLESQLARFVDAELYMVTDSTRLSLTRILVSIFVRSPGLCENACKGSPSQHANLIVWLKAAVADGRLSVKDFALVASVFYGLISGLFNFPALFRPLQSEAEFEAMKNEAIAVFLSRYRKESRSDTQSGHAG